MPDFVVTFEKDKDYRRFLITHVLTNYKNGMITLEFIEETTPLIRKLIIPENGEIEADRKDSDVENIVHATGILHPESLPFIIKSLQSLYDRYLTERSGGGDAQHGKTKE